MKRNIGEKPLPVARHPCGLDCSHTYKSHARRQRSKTHNNRLVCGTQMALLSTQPPYRKKKNK